jgi:putative membrane-bound dehydrogenase-like protein
MHRIALIGALTLLCGCRKSAPPYSPKDALTTFKIESGYHIETFVTEPDVVSPVAMDVDENGDIYVVEDRGYPLNIEGKLGRVKMLHSGRVTIFADHLVLPTGVMRWKKGILVTDAPDVWYLEDTDGDGVADVKRKVLTGFPFTNPQHTVNGLVYGLDNWIYLAAQNPATATIFKKEFGDRGSDIRYVDREGVPPLQERGRNVRFRPDINQLEALSGNSQFGQSFDDWGRHFTVSNSNHVQQETIAARYLKRNPDLPVRSAIEDISDHDAAAKVYSIVEHPRFEMLSGVGQFTSACGITYYRGSSFTAEPVHGIVHRDVLVDNGAIYLAKRAQEGVEFLASTDAWFRPVNMYIGPDGAMYVLDYYRMVIEHPEWMATKHHHSPDLIKGIDRGRIYRVVPDGVGGPLQGIHLGSASNQELVAELANPVIWWRRTAQRLLVDRKAVDVTADLIRLFEQSQSPQGRVHALWTLEGLGKLDAESIRKALADPVPGVRENGIKLAELHLPELEKDLLKMGAETDSRVRYQLLLTLGFLKSPASQSIRERLLFDNLEDKWFQVAALSASSDDAPRLFEKAVAVGPNETKGKAMLYGYLAAVIGARQKSAEIERLMQRLGSGSSSQAASLDGLNQGLRGKHGPASKRTQELLLGIFETGEPKARGAALRSIEILHLAKGEVSKSALVKAAARARDPKTDAELRADSIGFLALAAPEENAAVFQSLIDPHQPEVVQVAAVRAYGKGSGDQVAAFLLKNWRSVAAPVRAEAADAIIREPSRVRLLVAALKTGDVQPWTLGFRHRNRLMMNADPEIREAARPILSQSPADREAVVKKYEAALDLKPDYARGEQVFRSTCSKCHRLNGYGSEVGPDLTTVRNQPKQWLLTNILIPSQSIAQDYESYVVETVSGGTFDGVIGPKGQSPTTVTLRHEDGKEDVIQRQDIKNMYVTNLSAMPGDMEKQVNLQQMADVIEYVKAVK